MHDDLPSDLGRRLGDLTDLPPELRVQLQAEKMGETEREIVRVLDEQFAGVANVDEIMVGLYRLSGKVHERARLSNKLYRMGQAGHIISVPKKKGVYRTKATAF